MLIQRKTELSANIVAFCRFLRGKGFALGPADEALALEAMTLMPFDDPEMLRITLKAVLPRSLAEREQFDGLYSDYWRQLRRAVDAKEKHREEAGIDRPSETAPKKAPSVQTLKSWLHGNRQEETEELSAYSSGAGVGQKDFSSFSEEELSELMRLINSIARMLATRYSRRYYRSKNTNRFDLRRTMRLNMRRGGEILELAFKQRRVQQLKLVMLCDVSKSMDLYSRFLIQFIYAFQNVYRRIETFVFSTDLYHISPQLRSGAYGHALSELSRLVPGWSGGTRIGQSLRSFVDDYGRKMLDDRTIVLILSDGWDTGDVELIDSAMSEIQRQAARVIWLNPLAGSESFEPTVRGMAAAWPYIDVFASVHNVDSLRRLAKYLK